MNLTFGAGTLPSAKLCRLVLEFKALVLLITDLIQMEEYKNTTRVIESYNDPSGSRFLRSVKRNI